MDDLLRLFPGPTKTIELKGCYLAEKIRQQDTSSDKPFIYTNFITSLDGRIAVERLNGKGLTVPKATANERDWRLFQELAAQADIIISSGRYLRDWAAGHAQEILRVDDDKFADLRLWRLDHGLPPFPDIVILSHRLDFAIPEVLQQGGRKAIVFTNPDAPMERIKEIEKQMGPVMVSDQVGWNGRDFSKRLFELGYRSVFSAAGPQILHLILSGQALDRQYLTLAPAMLGGERFSTLLEGPKLQPPAGFELKHVYLDMSPQARPGQLFLRYDAGLLSSRPSSSKID